MESYASLPKTCTVIRRTICNLDYSFPESITIERRNLCNHINISSMWDNEEAKGYGSTFLLPGMGTSKR